MRRPTVLREAMVATSHPLATRAGVRALERGGNAVDAALAAAAMLCVAEPGHTGVGGDLFAQVWWDGELHGLNGSGRSPAELPELRVHERGPRSVTVPGSVRAWADLAERFGRLGLDSALGAAIDAAEHGIAATERVAEHWALAGDRAPRRAPGLGEVYALPELARTLRAIALEGPSGFYTGTVAESIAAASWLSTADLAAHRSEWVEPLRLRYRDVEVCELPPNGQGAAALIALALLEELPDTLHARIEATKLALADAYGFVADAPLPAFLLDPEHLASRRALVSSDRALDPEPSTPPRGGTTYLCAVDGDRNSVSLIQSLYEHFGSGVVAGETGVVLQNRGACFVETEGHPNRLAPAKRPFHTIIPGLLLRDGALLGPFGVMGGAMQAQGHVQLVHALVDRELDPQRALDEPRFRVDEGRQVALEPGLWTEAPELRALGHEPELVESERGFGVGQCVLVEGEALVGGSDGRGDGHVSGA
ncbi:MAG TPA: gamma-glutamyltransferase [Gaiellaceae bacterium]|nr:gamma-glutamyltransferase [Gaiellaceae bacterium]